MGHAGAAHVGFGEPGEVGQPRVGKAHHLEPAQSGFVGRQPGGAHLFLGLDDLADAGEEPRVEHGDGVDLVIGKPVAHGLCDGAHAVGVCWLIALITAAFSGAVDQ